MGRRSQSRFRPGPSIRSAFSDSRALCPRSRSVSPSWLQNPCQRRAPAIRNTSLKPNGPRTMTSCPRPRRTGRRTRAVYDTLLDRLFDVGLTAQAVVEDCGIRSHNIYSRFHLFVGTPIKSFVIHHRMECAKRLLRHDSLPIFRVAYAVGYASAGGFSTTFKRYEGCSPSAFQKREEG